jgi:hypothetical protein
MAGDGRSIEEKTKTTYILGAGFSKIADLPIQKEFSDFLLSDIHKRQEDLFISIAIKKFLTDIFGWHDGNNIPTLEDIFTCIDLSSATGHCLGHLYAPQKLRALRRFLINRIFKILELKYKESGELVDFLKNTCRKDDDNYSCNFVVLNWDIVLEKHLRKAFDNIEIDYCCDSHNWNNPILSYLPKGIPICKMHGSSNWVYCESCKRLFYDLDYKLALYTRAGLEYRDFKQFNELFRDLNINEILPYIAPDPCPVCHYGVSSHIATFSFRKSFRTHAYPSIWYKAEQLLAKSNRWVFIGYSLPDADFEFKHLLKAAQKRLEDRRKIEIDVVVFNDDAVKDKYSRFFGADSFNFYNDGFMGYYDNKFRNMPAVD